MPRGLNQSLRPLGGPTGDAPDPLVEVLMAGDRQLFDQQGVIDPGSRALAFRFWHRPDLQNSHRLSRTAVMEPRMFGPM